MTDHPTDDAEESWSALLIRPPEGTPSEGFEPDVLGDAAEIGAALQKALPLAEHGPGFARVGKTSPYGLVLFYRKEGPVDAIGVKARAGQASALALRKVCEALGLGIYRPETGDFLPLGARPRPIVRVESVDVAEVRPLRQRILRPHQPATASVYPGDDEDPTLHLGVRRGRHLVAVASAYWQARAEGPSAAYRIRGMAVAEDAQRQGLGHALVEELASRARAAGAKELWCNARDSAQGFYEAVGFSPQGDEFEIEGLGPHRIMVRVFAA